MQVIKDKWKKQISAVANYLLTKMTYSMNATHHCNGVYFGFTHHVHQCLLALYSQYLLEVCEKNNRQFNIY